jgi:hypothetical protein
MVLYRGVSVTVEPSSLFKRFRWRSRHRREIRGHQRRHSREESEIVIKRGDGTIVERRRRICTRYE